MNRNEKKEEHPTIRHDKSEHIDRPVSKEGSPTPLPIRSHAVPIIHSSVFYFVIHSPAKEDKELTLLHAMNR